jgi:hypothetical protein
LGSSFFAPAVRSILQPLSHGSVSITIYSEIWGPTGVVPRNYRWYCSSNQVLSLKTHYPLVPVPLTSLLCHIGTVPHVPRDKVLLTDQRIFLGHETTTIEVGDDNSSVRSAPVNTSKASSYKTECSLLSNVKASARNPLNVRDNMPVAVSNKLSFFFQTSLRMSNSRRH